MQEEIAGQGENHTTFPILYFSESLRQPHTTRKPNCLKKQNANAHFSFLKLTETQFAAYPNQIPTITTYWKMHIISISLEMGTARNFIPISKHKLSPNHEENF